MKHNYSKTLLTLAISASALVVQAHQTTVVKREWFVQNEKVDTIPITATVLDVAQNIITTGNVIVTGQSTNILTSKIAPDGTILWQQQITVQLTAKTLEQLIALMQTDTFILLVQFMTLQITLTI